MTEAEDAIDNLRAAFAWSRDNGDVENALSLTSMLWPLWVARGRLREGLSWFDAAFADGPQDPSNPRHLPERWQTGRASMRNWAARISSTTRGGHWRSHVKSAIRH